MKKNNITLLTAILVISLAPTYASEIHVNMQNNKKSPMAININTNKSTSNDDLIKIITLDGITSTANITEITKNSFGDYMLSGNDKFAQANIPSAYRDYAKAILVSSGNDFQSLVISYKLANIGFFTLSQQAINHISDTNLYEKQIHAIKNIFFPATALSYEEEVQLAELYTDIYYNNLTKESAKELNKQSNLLKKSDYANYVMAQAYFEAGEFNKANNYINKALNLKKNSPFYLQYKAKILCETKDYNDALKILNTLSNSTYTIESFKNSIDTQKEFTLSRANNDNSKSKYHLAKYFMLLGDNNRALKEANSSLASNKKNYETYTLIGDIQVNKGEFSAAKENYKKALNFNKKYSQALKGLGNIEIATGTYEDALNYYNLAQKYNKNDMEVQIAIAQILNRTGNSAKAKEICTNIALKAPNYSNLYYTMSEIYPEKQIEYLQKALSLNAFNYKAWIDLAEINILKNNFKQAEIELLAVKANGNENYKYYYVEGLFNKQNGNTSSAITSFKKSLKLNPNYTPAQKELNTLNL